MATGMLLWAWGASRRPGGEVRYATAAERGAGAGGGGPTVGRPGPEGQEGARGARAGPAAVRRHAGGEVGLEVRLPRPGLGARAGAVGGGGQPGHIARLPAERADVDRPGRVPRGGGGPMAD